MKKENYRYTINISFVCNNMFSDRVPAIVEKVKSIKEAREYKELIDETVAKACIIDNLKGVVVEWLKK